MTFGEIPIATWFVLDDDHSRSLFKWDDQIAEDEQKRRVPIPETAAVLVIERGWEPPTAECRSHSG